MPIHSPGRKIGSGIALRNAKKAMMKRGARNLFISLNLTAMVDTFVVLVLFLFQNFSATGEFLFVSKDILLPKAKQVAMLDRNPVITLTKSCEHDRKGCVLFNGSYVHKVSDLDAEDTYKSDELAKQLDATRKWYEVNDLMKIFQHKVIIQADESVHFITLKKVLNTCAATGFYNVQYAVNPL